MKIPQFPDAGAMRQSLISATLAAGSLLVCMQAFGQSGGTSVPAPAAPASAPTAPPLETSMVPPPPKYAANEISRAFNFMDSNHDGQISRAEAASVKNVAKHFDAADTNHNGMLSQSEFDTALNSPRVQ